MMESIQLTRAHKRAFNIAVALIAVAVWGLLFVQT